MLNFWSIGANPSQPSVKSAAPAVGTQPKIAATSAAKAPSGSSWPQRSYAVLLVVFAMFIGAWTAPLSMKSAGPERPNASVGAAAQETFGRVLAQSVNRPMGSVSLSPFGQFRRLSRTTPGLHLSAELFFPSATAQTPIMVMDSPVQRLPSASWPAATPENRPASGVRGWLARHLQDS
jgi:hypothetical protein